MMDDGRGTSSTWKCEEGFFWCSEVWGWGGGTDGSGSSMNFKKQRAGDC